MQDTAKLPPLALQTPEQIDRAVTHAFWTLRGLIQGLQTDPERNPPVSAPERLRRRALMQKMSAALEASVCTETEGAPAGVRKAGG